jgi:hypothetical protein
MESTQLLVNLIPKAVEALNQAATLSGDTHTNIVNRALQVYAFVLNEQSLGQRWALIDSSDTIRWVRLL